MRQGSTQTAPSVMPLGGARPGGARGAGPGGGGGVRAAERDERSTTPRLATGGIEGPIAAGRQGVEAGLEGRPAADDAVFDHLDEHAIQAADDSLVVEATFAFEFEHADEAAGPGGHGGHS